MRYLLILAMVGLASSASAQTLPSSSDTEQLQKCLKQQQHSFERLLKLLSEAKIQMQSNDVAVRRDAQRAVLTLRQRTQELSTRISACVPRPKAQVRVVKRTGTEASVQESNDVPTLDTSRRLNTNVAIKSAHRVDGTGSVARPRLQRLANSWGRPLSKCYSALVDRSQLQKGALTLTFTIRENGAVGSVSVENSSVGDKRFFSCVKSRVHGNTSRPTGGSVTISYVFSFGPTNP